MTRTNADERGIGVLVVIAATAVLAAVVSGTTLAAAAAAGAAAHRHHEAQARTLASAAFGQLETALATGAVATPGVGAPLRSVNGDLSGLGRVPSPGAWWPPAGEAFDPRRPTYGVIVDVERVVGPDGAGRGLGGTADSDPLLRVRIQAWFRSARAERVAKFVVGPAGARRVR